ncbi:MAG: hypothetical protein H5T96_09545 [Tissierellales bacterium]|nr:hypothetical protein [Tissierellales bacterium]
MNKYENRKEVPAEIVIKIAEDSTEIDDIKKRTRKQEYYFARAMAANYLIRWHNFSKVGEMLNVGHDIIHYYMGQDVLKTDPKYLKLWQRHSVNYFKTEIEKMESSL